MVRQNIYYLAITAVITVVTSGCSTTQRGMHTLPVPRDYAKLEQVTVEEGESKLMHARRRFASNYAPYEFDVAGRYLAMAREQKAQGDSQGFWDYAGLAKRMAGEAADKCPDPVEPAEAKPLPRNRNACLDAFRRLEVRYRALDHEKAREVAPVLMADLVALLSFAEHNLQPGQDWHSAAHALAGAAADLDALDVRDSDGDDIPDLKDGAPLEPEDMDDFEDEDGVPDPDNDGDDVPDVLDKAPLEPETVNRWRDGDGAPDTYPDLAPVLFVSGSSSLSSEAQGYLAGLVVALKASPDVKLRIQGHTSDIGTDLQNLDLSRRRAETVRNKLLELGIPDEQLVTTFHGATQPLETPGATAAQQQRVELHLE